MHGEHRRWIDIKQLCSIAEHLILTVKLKPQQSNRESQSATNRVAPHSRKHQQKYHARYHSSEWELSSVKGHADTPWKSKMLQASWSNEVVRVKVISEFTVTPSYLGKHFPAWRHFGQVKQPLIPLFSLCESCTSYLRLLDFLWFPQTTLLQRSPLLSHWWKWLPQVAIQSWSNPSSFVGWICVQLPNMLSSPELSAAGRKIISNKENHHSWLKIFGEQSSLTVGWEAFLTSYLIIFTSRALQV